MNPRQSTSAGLEDPAHSGRNYQYQQYQGGNEKLTRDAHLSAPGMPKQPPAGDFAVSIPFAAHSVYTALSNLLPYIAIPPPQSGVQKDDDDDYARPNVLPTVLKLMYELVPFLCIYAAPSSISSASTTVDFYTHGLLTAAAVSSAASTVTKVPVARIIDLAVYVSTAFSSACRVEKVSGSSGCLIWTTIDSAISRVAAPVHLVSQLMLAGIVLENREVILYCLGHAREWVRRVAVREIAVYLGSADACAALMSAAADRGAGGGDDEMRVWLVSALAEICLSDSDGYVSSTARSAIEAWPVPVNLGSGKKLRLECLFQAVLEKEATHLFGHVRGMFHREEGYGNTVLLIRYGLKSSQARFRETRRSVFQAKGILGSVLGSS